jgi:hypothetical protein
MNKDLVEEFERWKESMCVEPGCPNLAASGYIYCEEHLHGLPQKPPLWVLEKLGFASTDKEDVKKSISNMNKVTTKFITKATEAEMLEIREELLSTIVGVETELGRVRGENERKEDERMSDEDIDLAIENMEVALSNIDLNKLDNIELPEIEEGEGCRTDRCSSICNTCDYRHSPVKCSVCTVPLLLPYRIDNRERTKGK